MNRIYDLSYIVMLFHFILYMFSFKLLCLMSVNYKRSLELLTVSVIIVFIFFLTILYKQTSIHFSTASNTIVPNSNI